MSSFSGVLYAEAPTGIARYQTPTPVTVSIGIREPDVHGPTCEQPRTRPRRCTCRQRRSPDNESLNVVVRARDPGCRDLRIMVCLICAGFTRGTNRIPPIRRSRVCP
ncbi:carboxylesterase family protein [Rhodococcus sp. IEGM1428]|uniref:carboxylesterase family protein n=1 Tax=Rhodococcus sp. IEGM1428 TaxID=3392191 RepID=UPI003D11BC01